MTNTMLFGDRSASTQAVDNVLRRVLKVRDPADSGQVAKALLNRYSDQAGALQNERSGLPVVGVAAAAPIAVAAGLTFGVEVAQAYDDFNRDMRSLIDDSQLKDIRAELDGWSRAIQLAADDGIASARMGLDARQRDRVFSARRHLGDYARLTRYVGALSPDNNSQYRKLAQSCDVLSGLMLVLAGDSLAAGGITRSSVVLQVPASDLVERRDAAVNALRMLVGSTQTAYGPNDWPRGLESYRRLLSAFDSAGQSDLRALFVEATLARTLDELIDLAAGNTADGLRALGTVALVTVERLQRLVSFAQATYFATSSGGRRLIAESPPLSAFLSALALFVEAFDGAGGAQRLLYIARPPIIFYGLYGFGGPDVATRRLLRLVELRGTLAEQIDCFLGCNCDNITTQLMLDKTLFDVDRAIDLYCLGSDANGAGDPERRAAAYGAVILALARKTFNDVLDGPQYETLRVTLEEITLLLQWPKVLPPFVNDKALKAERLRIGTLIHSELCLQRAAEPRWARMVAKLAPACRGDLLADETNPVIKMLEDALFLINAKLGDQAIGACPAFDISIPPHLETSLDTLVNDNLANGF